MHRCGNFNPVRATTTRSDKGTTSYGEDKYLIRRIPGDLYNVSADDVTTENRIPGMTYYLFKLLMVLFSTISWMRDGNAVSPPRALGKTTTEICTIYQDYPTQLGARVTGKVTFR